jgi:hypothetical protein
MTVRVSNLNRLTLQQWMDEYRGLRSGMLTSFAMSKQRGKQAHAKEVKLLRPFQDLSCSSSS